MERARDDLGVSVASLVSTKVERHSLASKLDRVRELYKGSETDRRAAVNRS